MIGIAAGFDGTPDAEAGTIPEFEFGPRIPAPVRQITEAMRVGKEMSYAPRDGDWDGAWAKVMGTPAFKRMVAHCAENQVYYLIHEEFMDAHGVWSKLQFGIGPGGLVHVEWASYFWKGPRSTMMIGLINPVAMRDLINRHAPATQKWADGPNLFRSPKAIAGWVKKFDPQKPEYQALQHPVGDFEWNFLR